MTDRELEQRLHAWYRAQVDEGETAPAELRMTLATLPATTSSAPRRLMLPDWTSIVTHRLVPISLTAAAAVVIVVIVGALLGPLPSNIGGASPDSSPSPVGTPPQAPGWWSPTGSMTTARSEHSAVRLADGRVLVIGGLGGSPLGPRYVASAELYDPDTGTWSPAGKMSTVHLYPTVTLLPDGRVLVAGGRDAAIGSYDMLASAEVFDPVTGTWSLTGSMSTARGGHTATLLDDGTVLVAGGFPKSGPEEQPAILASAEIYDPSAGAWRLTASMIRGRLGHGAALLDDGTVLVAGGAGTADISTSAELFDPGTESWRDTGSFFIPRPDATATRLADGRVLLTGGMDARGEIYDPTTGTWSPAGRANGGCWDSKAVLLADGRVLQTCGRVADVFDAATGQWLEAGPLNTERNQAHTATLLADGRVLLAGGIGNSDSSILASAEIYDPRPSR